MTEKPSEMFAKQLRAESRFCQSANSAALLQEVAAWLDGGTIFEEPRKELWETADRLCGASDAEREDVLRSAHCIAERKGQDTDWETFARRIAGLGIGSVTPRVFKLPRDES